jgi:translation initiation factor IF-1
MDAGEAGRKRIETNGRVEEMLPQGQFLIRLADGRGIRAMVARESRAVVVKIIPGDRVVLELYPLDSTRGVILRKVV